MRGSPVAILLFALAAQAQSPVSMETLRARLEATRQATDFRAAARLVRVTPSGGRTSYNLSLRARSFAGNLKVFCEVANPAPARVRLLLESPASGPPSIFKGHAGDAGPVAVSPERWGDSLLDTAFTYEDLLENQFQWRNQSLEGAVHYGARDCYLVKSIPGANDRSHLSMVVSWLDQATLSPVRVEKTSRPSGAVREFVYFGLRQSKGIWSASQVEVKARGQNGSSLLIITRGSEQARVSEAEFKPELLIGP